MSGCWVGPLGAAVGGKVGAAVAGADGPIRRSVLRWWLMDTLVGDFLPAWGWFRRSPGGQPVGVGGGDRGSGGGVGGGEGGVAGQHRGAGGGRGGGRGGDRVGRRRRVVASVRNALGRLATGLIDDATVQQYAGTEVAARVTAMLGIPDRRASR